jgi:hypothetical protein
MKAVHWGADRNPMTFEIACEWFPPFLAVAMMTPSHPLRESALNAAEQSVRDSYMDAADPNLPDPEFAEQQEAFQDHADDVIKVLRGVADWVVMNVPDPTIGLEER